MKAIDIIEERGAKVIAAISIMNRGGDDTKKYFKEKGINFRYVKDLKNCTSSKVSYS